MGNATTNKMLVLTAVVIMGASAFAGCFGTPPPPPPPPANINPFANAAVQGSSLVSAGDSVSFTATGSDLDGSITAWRWNFGDSSNAATQNASHAFAHQGTYYVTLNITDNSNGTYDTLTTGAPIRINVLPNFPDTTPSNQVLAGLSLWSPSSVIKPGDTLSWAASSSASSFDADSSLPGKTMDYTMAFGDGATETHDAAALAASTWNGNFTHTYTASGIFASQLTIHGSAQTKYKASFVDNADTTHASSETQDNLSLESGAWDGVFSHTFANGTKSNVSDDFATTVTVTKSGGVATFSMNYGEGAPDSHTSTELSAGSWNGKFTRTYSTGGVVEATITVTPFAATSDSTGWTVISVSQAPTPGIKNPRTLIIETFGQPASLDPAVAYDDASGQIIQAVYETLITYDGAAVDRFIPLLAETMPTIANGGITNSNMTYTFHLRHGVKFHSGAEMKAADVVYSFKRVLDIDDPGGPAWILSQVLNNTSTVAIDDYTVQFTLMQPYGAFMSTLAYTVAAVVNKATVEANGGLVYHKQNTWMNTHTDGTGPWVFKSWVNGQQIVLDKNAAYYNATTAAKLDHVIIRFVTEFSTRLLELRSGDADIIQVPGANRPEIQAVAANSAEKVKVESGASTWVVFTGAFNFNINVSQRGDIGTVPSPDNVPTDFFQDLNMRKAFSLAFDYNDYITNVAKGLAFRMAGIIPKGMYGYNAAQVMPQYDLDAAKLAYNATSYVTTNGYSTGFNLTIGYNAGNTNRQKASENLKRGVEALGPNIHLNVVGFEWSVYLGLTLQTPSGQPGALGVFFIGWGPDYADPDDYIVPFCKSGGTYPAFTGYSNTTVDGWIATAGSIPNGPERLALYGQITDSIVNNYVYLYVTEGKNFHVAKTWVQGWYFNPMFSGGDLGGNMASITKS